MDRNAYLFAASVTRTQLQPTRLSRGATVKLVQTWGDSPSVLVGAGNPEDAQKTFEEWLNTQPEGQDPWETRVHKVVAAQLVDELLTDTGLAEPVTDGPPVPDLDGAAVIGVRNSAVAVWRWRRYAADTKLAGNQIRLDSWCGILGLRLSDTPA